MDIQTSKLDFLGLSQQQQHRMKIRNLAHSSGDVAISVGQTVPVLNTVLRMLGGESQARKPGLHLPPNSNKNFIRALGKPIQQHPHTYSHNKVHKNRQAESYHQDQFIRIGCLS